MISFLLDQLMQAKARAGFMVAVYKSERSVIDTSRELRLRGHSDFELISPYPLHEAEEALGIKRSFIPYITFIFGVLGFLGALWFTWWTSAVNWPINVGGKPFFSLPAFIPVIFEITVLFAALSSVAALFIVTRLFFRDPLLKVIREIPSLSDDEFAIVFFKKDFSRLSSSSQSEIAKIFELKAARVVEIV